MVLGSWQLNTVVTVLFLGTSLALVQRCDQDHFCETGYERSLLLERDNLLDRRLERNNNRQNSISDDRLENDWRHTGREDVTRDRLLRAEWHSVRKSSSEPGILGDKARFNGLDNPRITDVKRRDSTERLERNADLDLSSQRRGGVLREEDQRELRQDTASEELRQKRDSRSINRCVDQAVEDRRSERFDREQSLLVRRERLMQDQVQRRGEMQLNDSAKQRDGKSCDRLRYNLIDRRDDRIYALDRQSLQQPQVSTARQFTPERVIRQLSTPRLSAHRGEDAREVDLVRAEARRGENFKKTDTQEVLRERTDREDAEIRVDSSQRISRDFMERSKVLAEPRIERERESIRSDQRLLTFDRRVDQQDMPRQRTDLNTRNEDLERSIDSTELRKETISETHRTDRGALDRISNRQREEIARSNHRRENSLERLDRRNERRLDRRDESVRREDSDRLDSMPLSNQRFGDFAQFVDLRVVSRQRAARAITVDQRQASQDTVRLYERTEVLRRYISREICERIDESLVERREETRRESVRATRNERHERDLDRLSNERHEDLVRTEDLGQRVDQKDAKRVIPRASTVHVERREYSQQDGTESFGREISRRIISRETRERLDESGDRIREDVEREQPESREQVNQRNTVEKISRDRSDGSVERKESQIRESVIRADRREHAVDRVRDERRDVKDRREETRGIIVVFSRKDESDHFASKQRNIRIEGRGQQERITPEDRQSRVDSSRQAQLNLREESGNREDRIGDTFRIAIRNSDRADDHIEFDNSKQSRLDNSLEQREKISREAVRTDRRVESPKPVDRQEICDVVSSANLRENAGRSVDERQHIQSADRYIEVGEGRREPELSRSAMELSICNERHEGSRKKLNRKIRQERTDRDHSRQSPRLYVPFAPISEKAQIEHREHQRRRIEPTSERRDRYVDDSVDYMQTFAKYAQPNILTVIQGTLLAVVLMKTLSFDNTKFANGVSFKLMELTGMTES